MSKVINRYCRIFSVHHCELKCFGFVKFNIVCACFVSYAFTTFQSPNQYLLYTVLNTVIRVFKRFKQVFFFQFHIQELY